MMAAIAVFAMVFAAGAVLLESSSNVDGATSYIQGDTDLVKTGGTLTFSIMYFETEEFDSLEISYKAELKDGRGNVQSNAVSPSSGTLTNGTESTLTVTAPDAAGKYTLVVTFTAEKDEEDAVTTERTQTVNVVEPIVLSAVLVNNSKVDFTDFAVYFKVNGELIEDSRTLVTVSTGGTTTASYEWVVSALPNGSHTFQVVAGDENVGGSSTTFLGGEGTFYVGYSDYGLLNILLVVLLIVLIIVIIYLYRKPVKNYGKPKSRR